ncbi:Adaptin N terminal region family protein [Tritrichomonas foetus]|uniref:Adaptin N terminal region family protein n=1 Tax=Tritrichomonas foetus TaxID=1144522 RepID=A0A1J4JWR2_9EUKA|nr:Adaptin N terminal region family protein [Tritrichomonas foetus]|eukprot:OHT01974.1 Adaptin N terminal region family protein [Tritrichomonas foetus]
MSNMFNKETKGDFIYFRNLLDSNNPNERKYGAQRVLAAVRAGENMGCLFSSMLRCVKTDDIQLKKLAYLYLVNYSTQEPEQAIMVVNTFISDSNDPSPIVRALAVRTMCRIKLDTVAEHMIIPLKRSLKDKDPYVRKTAAMAVSKIYDIIPEAVENAQILSDLLELLNDENPMVVSNTTASLFEINERRSTPVFELDEKTVTPVISAMTQCSGWVQTILLDSLARYVPTDPNDASFLIDRLIPYLKHANSAVVIGAFKCIYHFMEQDKRSPSSLFQQIIPPFITLINSAEPEIQFVVLKTLSLFVKKYPKALAKESRVFFCKYNDPSYIKLEKLSIIVTITNSKNVQLVLDEFEEYCNSVDVKFVRKTISCIGQIAIQLKMASRRCVGILVKLVESKAEYAIEESIVVVSDLLRKFPGEFEGVIQTVCSNLEMVKESRAKAAAIWILGEYSGLIDHVDALLDPFLDTFQDEMPDVQHQILSALVKVYVRKPEETRDQLQYILNEATKETVLPDVRNRAMIYWRLLSLVESDVAKRALIFAKTTEVDPEEHFDPVILNELIQNMGTVSGVLHIIPSDFVKRVKYLPEDDDLDEFNHYSRNHNNFSSNANAGGEAHDWSKAIMNDGQIDVFYEFLNHRLWLKVVNKSQSTFNDFAVAFNKNWAGLSLAGNPKFPSHLEYGDSFEVAIDLGENQAMVVTPFEHNMLQVALRTNFGPKMFAVEIDPSEIIIPTKFSDADLKNAWESNSDDTRIEIDGKICSIQTFEKRGIHVMQTTSDGINAALKLPPNYIFIVKISQSGGKTIVMMHGNKALFQAIRGVSEFIFCE